jgi:glycolate oxidase FAD binding subunit
MAVNVSGPRRYGFGALRDYVLGISTLNDEGREVKAGGRVVKNVAGYDLCKLHLGALGTLGIITQVTLKVLPRPEGQALLTFGCGSASLETILELIHQSRTRPVCIEVLNGAAAQQIASESGLSMPTADWVVLIGFEESQQAVNWQMQQMIKEMPADQIHGLEARADVVGDQLWRALGEFPVRPNSPVAFKANLAAKAVATFCLKAAALQPQVLLQAQAGSGIVRGCLSADLTLERAQVILKELGDLAATAQGNLILPQCLTGWKKQLPVWGRPRNDSILMRQVKEKFDPHRLFNPGRFVDGI